MYSRLPAHALHEAHHVGPLVARRHEVDEPHHPAVRFEFRLENQRARPVAAPRWSGLSGWAHDPAPVAGLAEEGGEARAGVEAGKTQPVDRSVPSHEGGRLRVAEDGVVFYAHKP